ARRAGVGLDDREERVRRQQRRLVGERVDDRRVRHGTKLPRCRYLPRMRVVGLWRFPVKSMGGEPLERAEVGELGITGDRQWGVLAVETGKVLTARREPKLLFASAR